MLYRWGGTDLKDEQKVQVFFNSNGDETYARLDSRPFLGYDQRHGFSDFKSNC